MNTRHGSNGFIFIHSYGLHKNPKVRFLLLLLFYWWKNRSTGSPSHLPAITQLVNEEPRWSPTSLCPQSMLLALQVSRWARQRRQGKCTHIPGALAGTGACQVCSCRWELSALHSTRNASTEGPLSIFGSSPHCCLTWAYCRQIP